MKLARQRKPRRISVALEELSGRGLDEFGELPGFKRQAEAKAKRRGHVITKWHRRGQHDPYGREAFCDTCGLPVIVSTQPKFKMPYVYGWALDRHCHGTGRES